jgi:DNA-binding LacI/PurR family transcriptional regulator
MCGGMDILFRKGTLMATIKDIARRLNISDGTVSRAFTGSSYVSEEMKKKILAVAKELNYKPHQLAVGLRTGKTKVIALVVPNISNPLYVQLVKNIENFCSEAGYSIILCNTDENIAKEKKHLMMLGAGLVDGIILVPSIRNSMDEEYIQTIPHDKIVLFNRNIENSDFDIVKADHYQGIFQAVEHFVSMGHRRIGAVVGDPHTSVGKERYKAFQDAILRFGLDSDEKLVKMGELTQETGYQAIMELYENSQPPSAVLIFNNILTVGSLAAIKHKNLKVPEELSLIGIDEIENDVLIYPPLTFIRQPLAQMSQKMYDILMKKLNDRKETTEQEVSLFPVELVVKDSCMKI